MCTYYPESKVEVNEFNTNHYDMLLIIHRINQGKNERLSSS